MKFEALKDSARAAGEINKPEVQKVMKDCDVVYGLEVKESRVVEFRKKTAEHAKRSPGAKSMAFTYDKDKGEYEVIMAAVTAVFGECVVMREE